MQEIITCEDVGYRQNGLDILRGINWRVRTGEHWAVLGPNGSGKTTLLRIACGYFWPTSGRVLRLGRELIDLGQLRRSIGWISDELVRQIPPSDTAVETVATGRFAQVGLKRLPVGAPSDSDLQDAAAELAQLGCAPLTNKPFGFLSHGERQQVLVARARMAQPMLLVLDEPTGGMDPGVRERFLGWLDARVTQPGGPTVLMVTHHVEEIVAGIANTLVLSGGRVYAAGPTREVVTTQMLRGVYHAPSVRLEVSGGRLWPIWCD